MSEEGGEGKREEQTTAWGQHAAHRQAVSHWFQCLISAR